MNRASTPVLVAVAVACFLAALSAVAWRQGRARLVMEARERLRADVLFERDERSDLAQKIRYLESRPRVREASALLGLRPPREDELGLIPLEDS
ncbi:MAG: hypothetical protein R3E10_04110 [Gemmatimonadota bacterium]